MTGAASFAQVGVNANNIIRFGEFVERTVDTLPAIAHSPAGTDQTWNYAGLLNSHTTSEFGLGAPSWYDGDEEFPDANLASYNAADGSTIFLKKDTDALDILGVYADFSGTGSPQALVFNPYDRLITFPSTYETEFFNTYTYKLTIDGSAFGVDSIVVQGTVDQTSNMDSWGEITTPLGTFDAIRQYAYEFSTTIIDAYSFGASVFNDTQTEETHTYSFWTNDAGARYTVLEYTYDPGSDMVMEVTWQSGAPYLSVQEEGLPTASVRLYPNPATDVITIDLNVEGKYDFEVIDGLGRRVLTGTIEGSTAPISVSKLENGIYTIHLLNTSTNQVNVERFVVQ